MATISYDGQSFLIDGRRIWLVSGSIHYARTPHPLWRRRIRAAKEAGLNCIETFVFWNVHEPSPGAFHFEGDANLRKFIQTIAEEGMYCILRPGPYVGGGWDFGGLPAWLHRIPELKIRQANGPFLEACARYLGAVLEQVKDLQINESGLRGPTNGVSAEAGNASASSANNSSGGAGAGTSGGATNVLAPSIGTSPIIMIQAENAWFCQNHAQEEGYLREIVRYLRESGCTVPISACNNLWARTDGVLDTWCASEHLAFDLRQLHVVQPQAPRVMSDFPPSPGTAPTWGQAYQPDSDAGWTSYRLGQILGVGAQFNVHMFHGGTNFGFYAGRSMAGPDAFHTTTHDLDAPLGETGARGPRYAAIKRVATFASQFGQLLANLDPAAAPATVAPNDEDHPLCVIHQTGSQGEVVFLLKSRHDKTTETRVMLPNGLSLPVPLGDDRVAWFVLRANLSGVAELTYTNLRPWAWLARKMLVLFGPAGSLGLVAINGAPLTVTVPEGHTPLVARHEEFTVVVLNTEQVDAAYLVPSGLAVGSAGPNDGDQPLPLPGWGAMTLVSLDGEVRRQNPRPAARATAPRLGRWQHAPLAALTSGSADDFKPIEGPASLEDLHCNFGYGWYRLRFPHNAPGNAAHAWAPQSADRLHVFSDGRPVALLGTGPGAEDRPGPLKLGKTTVVLADNLGRYHFGWAMGESKGLYGHIAAVRPLKLPKPKIVADKAPDPFALSGFVLYQRLGDRPPATAAVWAITARKRALILEIRDLPSRAMLLVNGRAIGLYDQALTAGRARFVLRPREDLKNGRNNISLAFFHELPAGINPAKYVQLFEVIEELTADAEWAFAPWSLPAADAFSADTVGRGAHGLPAWHRTTFNVSATDHPLWLEPTGMSKGQIILNGQNVGRYFVATPSGKSVPPQRRYYLPEPWLRTDTLNELLLFDEHGNKPDRCRLVYDAAPGGAYGE